MKNLASCWLLILLLIFQTNTQGQTTGQKSQLNVAILIFDGVQMIDYTGPYEAFSGVMGGDAQFKVYTVAEKSDAVKTNSGMSINPQFSFKDVPQSDIVVIPGGITRNVLRNPTMLKWVQDEAQKAKITMSVCTGAFILAKAGLLDGLQATTTAGHTEGLKKWAPKARVVDDKRFVDAGRIVTTAGGTSSIDGALHVIEKVFGKGTAQMTALNMEYDFGNFV
jgi:transcriptional regulator GlxA family with amidase domain